MPDLLAALAVPIAASLEGLRDGLRGRGDVEGRDLVTEQRYAEGKPERVPSPAAGAVPRGAIGEILPRLVAAG